MAIKITDDMRKVWIYLVTNGLTEAGAAGMMGNIQAESGCKFICLENLCIKRYKERRGITYTSESYMKDVDSGVISRTEFLNPMGLQYAWGLCQWTSPSRKAGLYDLCKSKGVSIGDADTQMEFLLTELKTSYAGVYKTLTTTADILTASNAVLTKFECPADCGASVRQARYNYSKTIYDEFKGIVNTGKYKAQKAYTEKQAIQKLIDVATMEIGYLEKASLSNLDSKTANAGSANYTKYWRDVYPEFQGQPWCACFVSWCYMKTFGLDVAKKMLKHWPYTYCPTLAGMTTSHTPRVGSVIIFYRNGVYAHTGMVVEVSGNTIITIEGNTSGASGIIANGGGVCRKAYDVSTLSPNTKYFHPDYSLAGATKDPVKETASADTVTSEKRATSYADKYDKDIAGTYTVTASELNIRNGAGKKFGILGVIPKGTKVANYGYYSNVGKVKWLYIQVVYKNVKYTGFCSGTYLKKDNS